MMASNSDDERSTEGMVDYNKNSAMQQQLVNHHAGRLQELTKRLGRIEPELRLVDYGCGPGQSAIEAVEPSIAAYRSTHADAAISVCHADQPGNDWNGLFGLVNGPSGYASSGIRTGAAVGSFYDQMVAEDSVDLGTCFMASHWLNHAVHLNAPGSVWFADLKGAARAKLAAVARHDRVRFLRRRSRELRRGGFLLVSHLGAVADDREINGIAASGHGTYRAIQAVAQDMATDGLIDQRALDGFVFGSVSEVYAWAADCCGEAGPRRCPPDHADEMEPSQIAVQVLRGDAAIAAQETLQLAVAAIDRLNVEGIPDPLSGRKVQGFVANAHGRSAGRIAAMTVRNQNDVGIQNRFEHRLQGLGVDRRKNLADGCAAAIGGDQDRHLFIRQAALAGLAATLARLAIQSARSLVALKHVSLVNFDNALEFRPILACGLQETVPPAEGRIDAKSASTGRFPYRLALGQRHAE